MEPSQTKVNVEVSDPNLHEEVPIKRSESALKVEHDAENPARPKEPHHRSSSEVKKIGVCVAVLLLLAAIIIVALFTFKAMGTQYDQSSASAEVSGTACNTQVCIDEASAMIAKMNESADPCEDFNEYACGRFNKERNFPYGESGILYILLLQDNAVLRDIIEEPLKQGEPTYMANIKRFYMSCTDEAKIEEVGVKNFLAETTFINDWPTLNSQWTEATFNLNNLIIRYTEAIVEPLFRVILAADMMDSKKKAIVLTDPDLGMPPEYFLQMRNGSDLMAYQSAQTEAAVLLGAPRNVAEQDAKDVVDLQVKLAQIMVPREDRRDASKQYNPVQIRNLIQMYPDLDIAGAVRASFRLVNIDIADTDIIINSFPTYIGNLSRVLNSTSKRVIQNLFGFKYAASRLSGLTARLRDIHFYTPQDNERILKSKRAAAPATPLQSKCIDEVSAIFSKGLGKQFVDRKFDQGSKVYVTRMVDNVVAVFKQILTDNSWMAQSTKAEAMKKINALRRKVGYPDTDFQDSDMDIFYKDYTMQADNYYANRVVLQINMKKSVMATLRQTVDPNEWQISPATVNAYYARSSNDIVFAAGILQPPLFSEQYQPYINYASIGSIVGHEITHGYDDQGSQYDADGNVRNFWQIDDKNNFMQKTQCIVDQFNNFFIPEIGKNLNGVNNQGEAVADSEGLKIAYKAYKALVAEPADVKTLPGLRLTTDQLFFLTFAQNWCERVTPAGLAYYVNAMVHPPGRYRILGTLQNNEEFAKAYNCRAGSYMNPVKKCSVY